MSQASNAPVGAAQRQPNLRRQVFWTLPANLIYGLCNLLLVVILHRFGSKSVVGQFGLAMGITAPLFMLANLRFSTLLATDVRSRTQLRDYFVLRIVLVSTAIAISIPLGALNKSVSLLVFVLACSKAIEAISELCCGVQQRVARMDRIAVSLVANGIVMASAFFLAYFVTRSLVAGALAICAARLTVLLLYDVPKAMEASTNESAAPKLHTEGPNAEQANSRARWMLLWIGAPLGITAALISLTSNIPRYVIQAIFDDVLLGEFVTLAIVLQAGNLVFRAVELPTIPKLARHIDRRDAVAFWSLLARAVGLFAAIGIAGSAAAWLIGGQVLALVFGPAFLGFGGLLALMTFGTSFSQFAGMIESSLIASRITAVQIPMHCVTALSCLGLCLTLIPSLELYGAVFAVTLCRIPFALIGLWLLHRKLTSPLDAEAQETTSRRAA